MPGARLLALEMLISYADFAGATGARRSRELVVEVFFLFALPRIQYLDRAVYHYKMAPVGEILFLSGGL